MFAKSAATLSTASASAQSKVIVSQLMDANDCKYISYRASVVRLVELKRLLNILIPNLKKRSSPDKAIVPLVTYMLPLLEGSVFNVNSTVRQKYEDIVNGVVRKGGSTREYDVTPRDWLTYVMDVPVNNVSEVHIDQTEFKKRLYDKDGQWDTVARLLKLVDETIAVYNNKFKSANLIKRNYAKNVEDLLRPSELSLCLDLAVLITDYEKDTSEASFKKLQWQVIDKFLANMHTKVEPTLKAYYKSLIAYQQGKLKLYNLPFPEYTIHRMFAFTIRLLELIEVFTSEVRVLYYANMTFLKDKKTKLVSENLYEYDLMIKQLEKLCADPLYQVKASKDIMQFLQKYPYSLPKSLPEKTHEMFTKKIIGRLISIWNSNTELVEKWVDMWKFCDKNTAAREKIDTSSEDQISKMYDERYTVDELAYLEKVENSKSGKKTVGLLMKSSSSSSPSLSPIKTPKKKLSISGLTRPNGNLSRTRSASGSNSNSNSNLSSGVATPTERSRRASEDQGFSRPSRLLTKVNTNGEKINTPLIHISENSTATNSVSSSTMGSPSVSRRGSVIDENPVKKTVVNRTIDRKKTKRGNRPRSASLQSNDSHTNSMVSSIGIQNNSNRFLKPTSIQSQVRSNSLESNSALNRKMVQDTFKHLMTSSSQKTANNNRSPSLSPLRATSPSVSRSNSNKTPNGLTSPEPKSKLRSTINKPNSEVNETDTIKVSPLPHEQEGNTNKKLDTNTRDSQDKNVNDKEYVLTSGNDTTANVNNNTSEAPDGTDENAIPEVEIDEQEGAKKVRFIGVPPMTDAENPVPTRKGWYKKPAVLHYPPVPKQVAVFSDRLRQEGMVFRTSLRDTVLATSSEVNKKGSMMLNFALDNPPVKEISGHSRFASKLREKLTR
ncbi:protein phosphatase regulator GIP4 [Nakaseomyces bracarensis]|uniref:protein phosphatase regulator GIP4 n=1 Tax=Nakaseomyces bracarensis TaxID=273131 RepID=UPI0038710B38